MVPVAPIAVAVAAVIVWLFRLRPKPQPAQLGTGEASLSKWPKSYDAKGWDELAGQQKPVALALEFWNHIARGEPEFFLPTWIELTGEEQKIVVRSMEKFAETGVLAANGQLKRVVGLAYSRGEGKTEDAEAHQTPKDAIEAYRKSKGL